MTFRTPLAAAATLAIALPACAGDMATLNILGFSADASTFAFEEYGVQDGSGFPYANRFYIDTATDSFKPGTPIRVRIDDENAGIADARAQARAAGEAVVTDSELAEHQGITAGFNAITELSADPFRMVVNPRPIDHLIDTPLEVRLEEIPFPVQQNCYDLVDAAAGFRLLSVHARPGGTTEVLHEDSAIPASRNCPTGYRIGGVQSYTPFDGPSAYAVLIAVQSLGFEGPDYRWMAVTRQGGQ